VWLLFSREKAGSWPKHLLCDGFRKQARAGGAQTKEVIPGLYEHYPNHRVRALKKGPWPQVLMLLGKEGERIMIDLLVDCAIFEPVKAGKDNLYQLCGSPAWELESITVEAAKTSRLASKAAGQRAVERRPTEITLARNRMLYARAALNAKGNITFGLRHIRTCQSLQPCEGSSLSF
jgi:telomerase reverse transcriptase